MNDTILTEYAVEFQDFDGRWTELGVFMDEHSAIEEAERYDGTARVVEAGNRVVHYKLDPVSVGYAMQALYDTFQKETPETLAVPEDWAQMAYNAIEAYLGKAP